MNGLQQLIDMRGGLRKGNFPTSLRRVIAWCVWSLHSDVPLPYYRVRGLMFICRADLTAATLLPSKLRFEAFEFANIAPPLFWPFAIPRIPDSSEQALSFQDELSLRPTFDDNLRDVFEDLWRFPNLEKTSQLVDHIWYSDKVYLVQRSLTDVAYNQRKAPHIDQACAIAALIYVHVGLCDVRLYTKIIDVLISRLKASLKLVMSQYNYISPATHAAERLLWALYFGGVAAAAGLERRWFVSHLLVSCEALNLKTWADMKVILETVFWKAEWENPIGALWRDLEAAREAAATKTIC